jgi:hypothetical protein
MSQPLPPKLPNSPRPSQPSKPNPQPPKPSFPPTSAPSKRTGFGDKKSSGPGTSSTGAKK